jgi:hypothetical protein
LASIKTGSAGNRARKLAVGPSSLVVTKPTRLAGGGIRHGRLPILQRPTTNDDDGLLADLNSFAATGCARFQFQAKELDMRMNPQVELTPNVVNHSTSASLPDGFTNW